MRMRIRTPILARQRQQLSLIFALLLILPTISWGWIGSNPKPSTTPTQQHFHSKSCPQLPLSSMITQRKAGIRPASTCMKTSLGHDNNMNKDLQQHADTSAGTVNYNWSIAALLLSAFLNLLGFTMAGPITPALGQHFGLTIGASFGSLTSAYPLGMLFGLFLWPSLSDRWGRPPVITFTLLGTGLGLAAQAYIVATNKSLWMFLLSRVVTGSFAGSSPVSKAYLADVSILGTTTTSTLSRNLAWRDAASTFAFLMGPLLGGVFLGSTTSLPFVISVSSVASLLAALVVGIVVQEVRVVGATTNGAAASSSKGEVAQGTNPVPRKFDSSLLVSCPLGTSLWSGVATVCLVSFLFNVGDSTFHAFFSTLLKSGNVSASNIGLVYSSLAAISLGVSSLATARIMKNFGPVVTCAFGLGAIATSLLAIGSGSNVVPIILAAAALYACGVPLYSPTIPTMLLRCVPPNRRGCILGLDGAINTVARILAPLVMGQLYKTRGPSVAFGLAGKATLLAATIAVGKRVHVLRRERKLVSQAKLP